MKPFKYSPISDQDNQKIYSIILDFQKDLNLSQLEYQHLHVICGIIIEIKGHNFLLECVETNLAQGKVFESLVVAHDLNPEMLNIPKHIIREGKQRMFLSNISEGIIEKNYSAKGPKEDHALGILLFCMHELICSKTEQVKSADYYVDSIFRQLNDQPKSLSKDATRNIKQKISKTKKFLPDLAQPRISKAMTEIK